MSTFIVSTISSTDMALLPRTLATRLNDLADQLNNLVAEINAARRQEVAAELARRVQAIADEIEILLKVFPKRTRLTFVLIASVLNACGSAALSAVLSVVSAHPVPRLRFVLPDKSLARLSLEIVNDDAVRTYRLG